MKIVGVRFQPSGKIYNFTTDDDTLNFNDLVIVETNRGKDLGKVAVPPGTGTTTDAPDTLKPVLRKATPEDIKQKEGQQKRNSPALSKCKELVAKLNLSMKPILASYNLDGSHVVIFFIAEKRVDFRELVKELSHELKSYVELRQVGARDESKLLGGIGKCGLPLCCSTFLTEFSPVSIKMAKEQNITLNPMKTSGLCGRLLCCLGYEFEQYRSIKESLPEISQKIETPMGTARVITINPLKQSVWVELESGATVEYHVDSIKWQKQIPPERKGTPAETNKTEPNA
ncbi:MAG TPA: regulatory iron-sulfur-containing complex subunit RicT [Dehalococcoidia bacterium]|nr:regulatory iron-sulfur-containing complex subunit RicT [Dehalococcoidia bacterium]